LPYADPERLMLMDSAVVTGEHHYQYWSYPAFAQLRANGQRFQEVACYSELSQTLTISDEPENEEGEIVSSNYFPMLGVSAFLGRKFRQHEYSTRNEFPVILISHRIWLNRFGGDSAAVGKTVYLDRKPFTLVGVMPKGFRGQSGTTDFWVPMMMAGQIRYPEI